MNLKDLNVQSRNMNLKDLRFETAQAQTKDIKTFDQNMNVQDLRNISVDRLTPKNVTVGQIQQVTTPSFEVPDLNNNTVNFDFSSESSQQIDQINK